MQHLLLGPLIALLLSPVLAAQSFEHVLTTNDGEASDFFGSAPAVGGGRGIARAGGDDDQGDAAGAAYVFDLATGSQLFKLTASDGHASAGFGGGVIEGNLALVGAPYQTTASSGKVYAYDMTTGAEISSFESPLFGTFGASLAVDNGRAIIGAPLTGTGYAYLFDVPAGQFVAAMAPPYTPAAGQFANAVDIDGGVVAVADSRDSLNGSNAGAVHLFDTNGQLLHSLFASDAATADRFGYSLSLDGDRLLVGAPFKNSNEGAVYLFDVTTGAELQKWTPALGDGGRFGMDVALAGGLALVGVPLWVDGQGQTLGTVLVYDVETGTALYNFTHADTLPGESFGGHLDFDGADAVIGVPGYDTGAGSNAGAAYAYSFDGPGGSTYCSPGVPNSTGSPSSIEALGTAAVADNMFALRASDLPPNQFGFFLASQTQGFVAGPGGSQGNLCLGGQIARLLPPGSITASGVLARSVDLAAIPLSPPQPVAPGETWNFQLWHRDVNPTNTSNFTDAVSVTFN